MRWGFANAAAFFARRLPALVLLPCAGKALLLDMLGKDQDDKPAPLRRQQP